MVLFWLHLNVQKQIFAQIYIQLLNQTINNVYYLIYVMVVYKSIYLLILKMINNNVNTRIMLKTVMYMMILKLNNITKKALKQLTYVFLRYYHVHQQTNQQRSSFQLIKFVLNHVLMLNHNHLFGMKNQMAKNNVQNTHHVSNQQNTHTFQRIMLPNVQLHAKKIIQLKQKLKRNVFHNVQKNMLNQLKVKYVVIHVHTMLVEKLKYVFQIVTKIIQYML